MKKEKVKKSQEITKEDYPRTLILLQELEELLSDKEEYKW